MKKCSFEVCDKTARTRGLCSGHYYQHRKGKPLTPIRVQPAGPCIVEGCGKPRHVAVGYCGMHNYRVKKYGTVNPDLARKDRRGKKCTIEGCGRDRYSGIRGWCKMHYDRWMRHGDPNKIIVEMGSGDDITVSAAHKRVEARWGKAHDHVCVDCGGRAAHWSYDHGDPNEKQSDHGPYSPDTDHYQARCVPCHKTFDLDYIAMEEQRWMSYTS